VAAAVVGRRRVEEGGAEKEKYTVPVPVL